MNRKILFVFYLTLLSVSLCHADLSEKQNGARMEEIVLAGGCFWGMEELFRKQEGVVSTEVGYAGGAASEATYEFVKTGKTAHAEALRVRFDTSKTNLETILRYFFKIHDPTTLDRQGNDIGSQYRSAIFYANENQRVLGASLIDQLEDTKIWKRKIVTKLEPLTSFTLAEDYHQDYLQKNPGGYTCHFERDIEF
jgi:methionine-S-sulfoxide reductase